MSDYTETQQKNTLRFFTELKNMRYLRDNCNFTDEDCGTTDSPSIRPKLKNAVRPFQAYPQPGEIRLLSQLDKITYVAILPWDWCHSLIVPLSHYEEPATDKEMRTENHDKKGLFQQVYQCWNFRTINNVLLAKSWLVNRMSDEEVNRLKTMMRYSLLGDELPDEIKNLTAAPIFREEDPRVTYMQEENKLFQKLDAMDFALAQRMEKIRERSFDSRARVIPFPAPCEFLQAASGTNELSGVYKLDENGQAQFVSAIECEDFRKVAAGEKVPHFTWETKSLTYISEEVFFRHSKSGLTIGSGMIFKEEDCFIIELLNSISEEDVPEICSPAEIEIIIQ